MAYCPLAFGYTNYARADDRPHLLRFTDLPGTGGGLLGGAGVAVSRACAYPKEAAAFSAWLCGAEVQRGLYVREGGQAGNRLAWVDAHNNALCNGFFEDTLRTLEQASVRPRDAGFVVFQAYAGRRIHDFLSREDDPSACSRDVALAFEQRRG